MGLYARGRGLRRCTVSATAALALSGGWLVVTAGPALAAPPVTLYVRVAADGGDDTHTCANPVGAACLTVQKAVDVAAGLTGKAVTINVGDGIFTPDSAVTLGAGHEASLTIAGQGRNNTQLTTDATAGTLAIQIGGAADFVHQRGTVAAKHLHGLAQKIPVVIDAVEKLFFIKHC